MAPSPFAHEALVYRDEPGFAEGAVPYLRAGVSAGELVFALAPPTGIALLRAALGDAAEQVRFLDVTDVGRNPARLIPLLRGLVDEADGRPTRGLSEPAWLGRPAEEMAEALLHESLLNLAFEDTAGFRLRCAFDGSAVAKPVLRSAEHSHPVMVDAGTRRISVRFDPEHAHAEFGGDLPAPESVSDVVHFCLDDLPDLRDLVGVRASAFGLPRDRALDLTLATNEIVTNSICHGGERGTLRLWTDGDAFVCEVSDSGHIQEPMVGRVAPRPSVQGGRGVWLANQLCDLVRIRSAAGTGTVVRLHVRR
ncbi:sensor histidine kinase [Actinokineospora iranica]|uniref:Anti-sigma regulatory factor (Ser/Thr protein kinase) n=1 Tax=Actinokineospora iranica TaxID=1271860 RepID=A0A1G6IYH9_9PSEU|nr:sensor histidine kinase [Actinokineospora iranica]SDC11480.1 Anti-sigma regulatory factor (Ser/Thr protein kinase) [Actinokineospora iranica]